MSRALLLRRVPASRRARRYCRGSLSPSRQTLAAFLRAAAAAFRRDQTTLSIESAVTYESSAKDEEEVNSEKGVHRENDLSLSKDRQMTPRTHDSGCTVVDGQPFFATNDPLRKRQSLSKDPSSGITKMPLVSKVMKNDKDEAKVRSQPHRGAKAKVKAPSFKYQA